MIMSRPKISLHSVFSSLQDRSDAIGAWPEGRPRFHLVRSFMDGVWHPELKSINVGIVVYSPWNFGIPAL